jgi:hypothetical protein
MNVLSLVPKSTIKILKLKLANYVILIVILATEATKTTASNLNFVIIYKTIKFHKTFLNSMLFGYILFT